MIDERFKNVVKKLKKKNIEERKAINLEKLRNKMRDKIAKNNPEWSESHIDYVFLECWKSAMKPCENKNVEKVSFVNTERNQTRKRTVKAMKGRR